MKVGPSILRFIAIPTTAISLGMTCGLILSLSLASARMDQSFWRIFGAFLLHPLLETELIKGSGMTWAAWAFPVLGIILVACIPLSVVSSVFWRFGIGM